VTVHGKALFRDRNQTIKRTLFSLERRPDALRGVFQPLNRREFALNAYNWPLWVLSNRTILTLSCRHPLKSSREDHRKQVDALLKSEARILNLEVSRGSLLNIDIVKSYISKILTPTIIWLRKLADPARNPEEKALLETLRDAGLAVINASAKEAHEFGGQ
jgi:hypothetical protein